MDQLLANMTHAGWELHDFYWLGACFFILHVIWLSPSILERKNIVGSLLIMTAFWPIAYTLSIYHIIRLKRLKR
ncbi:MAG TPA: hypothetical protein VF799_09435 [Geobacteraceae bacterium]